MYNNLYLMCGRVEELTKYLLSLSNEEKKEIGNEWKHIVQTRDVPKRVKNSRELETLEEIYEESMRSNRQSKAFLIYLPSRVAHNDLLPVRSRQLIHI